MKVVTLEIAQATMFMFQTCITCGVLIKVSAGMLLLFVSMNVCIGAITLVYGGPEHWLLVITML